MAAGASIITTFGLGFGVVDGGCYVSQLVATPFGPRYRTINVCAY